MGRAKTRRRLPLGAAAALFHLERLKSYPHFEWQMMETQSTGNDETEERSR